MTENDRVTYARLLLTACNPRPGQNLLLVGEPELWPLMLALTEAAYDSGVRFVDVQSVPRALQRARALHSQESYLAYRPATQQRFYESLLEEEWALIAVHGPENPDELTDVPAGPLGLISDGDGRVKRPFREALRRDRFNWLVCAAPTHRWAQKVLGVEAGVEQLWEVMRPILRLNTPDPVAAWGAHQKRITERAQLLTELQPVALHFSGGGTDLTVPLNPNHIWLGGGATNTTNGRRFSPNLPSEEVFTTPFAGDPAKNEYRPGATGRVVLSKPAQVLGQIVEGVVLTFEDGEVTEVSAQRNLQTLKTFLSLDEGCSRMGEIALVDIESPIYRTGLVFYDTLLDENAACHFALGFGYPDGVEGGIDADEQKLRSLGVNSSRYHLDFMFGHADLSVTARLADDSSRSVMQNGLFVDPF